MIHDTSAQDRPLARQANRKKMLAWIAAGVAVAVALAAALPTVLRLVSADSSASLARLRIAQVI